MVKMSKLEENINIVKIDQIDSRFITFFIIFFDCFLLELFLIILVT